MTHSEISSYPDYILTIYLAFLVAGGYIGLPIVVVTFLVSRKVTRHPAIINFCLTWIIYSVVYTLLIFSGHRTKPPETLCITQAALIHGSSVMVAVSTLSVVLHWWNRLSEPNFITDCLALEYTLVIVPPYIVFLAFVIAALSIAIKNRKLVDTDNGIYCTILMAPLTRYVVPGFCAFIGILVLITSFAILLRCYSSNFTIKKNFPLIGQTQTMNIYLRLIVLTLFAGLVLGICIYLLYRSSGPVSVVVQAALPFGAFVVVGVHRDLSIAWGFVPDNRRAPAPSRPKLQHSSLDPGSV